MVAFGLREIVVYTIKVNVVGVVKSQQLPIPDIGDIQSLSRKYTNH
jgi:hypothetical protein